MYRQIVSYLGRSWSVDDVPRRERAEFNSYWINCPWSVKYSEFVKTEKKRFKAKIINIKWKWLYPKNHVTAWWNTIVRVSVVFNRAIVVASDWSFDNLCKSHQYMSVIRVNAEGPHWGPYWLVVYKCYSRMDAETFDKDVGRGPTSVHRWSKQCPPFLTLTESDVHPLALVINSVHVAFYSCKGQSL